MPCMLEVEPSEVLPLIADGSCSNLNASITLRNTQANPILFRIQTTSPLSYRVKPSHGWVLPGSTQTVTVLHVGQANTSSGSVSGGKTDKFLIKYGAADAGEVLPERDSPQASEKFTQLWATLADIGEYRLKCSFPGDQSQQNASPVLKKQEPNVSEKSSFVSMDASDSNNNNINGNQTVASLKEQLAQANQKIAQLEAKLLSMRKDHLSSAEASGDLTQTIDALLAAQSKSLPPVLIVLIALFFFLLGLLF